MQGTLHLYRLSQNVNNDWDTFDSFIVAGYSEEGVRGLYPPWENDEIAVKREPSPREIARPDTSTWPHDSSVVKVECIGIAAEGIKPGQVLCSSFNAG